MELGSKSLQMPWTHTSNQKSRLQSKVTWSFPHISLGIPGPATGVIWALRAESCKQSSKMGSRALPAPRPKKSRTESKKSQNRQFLSILTLFRLRFGLFGPRGREGPGTHFRTLFATFGPKGPNDPCSGQKFSQTSHTKRMDFNNHSTSITDSLLPFQALPGFQPTHLSAPKSQ